MNTRLLAFSGVLATAIVLGACGDDDDAGFGDDDDDGGLVASGATQSAAGTPAAPSSGGAVPGTTGDEPLPQAEIGRKIIFTANLSLNAENVGGAFNEAVGLARSNGGYVDRSQFSNDTEDNSKRSATLTIRVPVQNYDVLLAGLRNMTGVSLATEGSNSNEVTEQYTDLESRLRNLERTEEQYLTLLNRATSINEILTVQDRLSGVRSQIEQIQGRLKVLDDQTDFATVNVSLAPIVAKVEEPKPGGWKLSEVFVESWEASFEVARYAAAAGMIALVVVAWLGIPVLLLFFITRRVRRRPPASLPEAR